MNWLNKKYEGGVSNGVHIVDKDKMEAHIDLSIHLSLKIDINYRLSHVNI